MRLRHIEVLHAIRRTGSLSRAAESLSITQPAASKILKHAEQQLGFPLFHRSRGRLQPTDQADVLMREIEQVFEALERTRRMAQTLRSELDTHLRVVCVPSLGMGLVPRAVQLFQSRRPRTMIEIASRHDPEIAAGLLARDFDIGIGFGPAEGVAEVPGLRAVRVDVAEMVFIDHPARPSGRDGQPIRLAQIDQKRLIGLTSGHFLGTAIKDAFRREDIALTPGIQVQTYYIARTLVAAGTGCAVIDEFTANAHSGDTVVRPLDPAVRFGVYVWTREQHPLSARGEEFVACLRTVCETSRRPASPGVVPEAPDQPQTAATAATNGSIWSSRKPARLIRPSATI
ncbi:LysR family transcriptional regulator [Rhodoplanes sp. TEM]|uniref:LysR family transcriptional regulator n=1 Tax=Rhodoplanes tepidamans TaxID=200616 RepID=A0ABT5J3Z0_RHOTP|nr:MULTISPECIES: LysR family transcriptional regulator [Rhodoplanes]MDC7784362.1 LysR family transcriptional regulator [Rhodoplanes tepidamans]MDC7983374.1 LysR family transcriptional regulator [Rhodoplanes sp. TEM]MDQ0354510.1 DNA-binding transcriptional LysR family regulator [Rhodoplanes tepidamans]